MRILMMVWLGVLLSGCSVLFPGEDAAPPPAPGVPTVGAAMAGFDDNGSVAVIDETGLDFAEKRTMAVYRQVSPSVVNVTTQVIQRGFNYLYRPLEGAGSGFVIDTQGHILTNYHVIREAQSIEITFFDETSAPAQVVGIDPPNDIAVLRVENPPAWLRPVELGTSANVMVGQRAIVIGNPFGQFGGTLTTGVVSALDRTIEGRDGRNISGVIQTDAAINQGNSGGPLLDSAGRVIGMNTAIFSPSGINAGIGFAVPVDTIRRVLPDLLEFGRYRHPWLGINYAYRLTPGLAQGLGLPVEQGLLLVEMFPNSPMLEAGIRGAQGEAILGNQIIFAGGDILTAIDEQSITSMEQLRTILDQRYSVDDTLTLTIWRDNASQQIDVTLIEEPFRY